MPKHILTALLFLTIGIVSIPVQAQMIDYGSFEELFEEPVTTSANGTPQRVSDVPLHMEIITADEIRKTPARNIPDVLRHVQGLQVRQNYANQYDVAIRGYNGANSERILVLVNGRQVYMDTYGYVDWALIPVQLEEIRQIEIVKGPNTALFGFNAVSGVINIITYNPLYSDTNAVTVNAGTDDYGSVSAVTTLQPSDTVGIRLSAGGDRMNDYQFPTTGSIENSIQQDTSYARSFSADMYWQATDDIQANIEVTKSSNDINSLSYSFGPQANKSEAFSYKGKLVADTDYGLIEAQLYQNKTTEFKVLPIISTLADLKFNNTVTVASLSDTFKIGSKHTFRIAEEYRKNEVENVPIDNGSTTSYDILSTSALWDWMIDPQWNVSLAGRYDHLELDKNGAPIAGSTFSESDFDQTIDAFSYNLGVVYKPTEIDTLRFIASRGIDIPSLNEFGYQLDSGIGFYALGDPETKASEVDNFELQYNRDVAAINGGFHASIFYQMTNEHQEQNARFVTGAPSYYYAGNVGDSQLYGFEMEIESQIHQNWDIALNYSYTELDTDMRDDDMMFEDLNPEHMANAILGYQKESWNGHLGLSYTSSNQQPRTNQAFGSPNIVDVDDLFLLQARIGYDFTPNINVSLNGRTALGEHQESSLGDLDSQAWLSLTARF